jgi:hypothetical protein
MFLEHRKRTGTRYRINETYSGGRTQLTFDGGNQVTIELRRFSYRPSP